MPTKYLNNFIQDIIVEDLETKKHSSIQTRFPPEPNGYLHIGHAKSIILNFTMANSFGGKCNLRFDDTNPEKESETYMQAIKKDVEWLGFEWGKLCYASDYFDNLYKMAIELIEKGLAYIDSQTPDEIKENRGSFQKKGINSPYRDRSVLENLDLFEKMKAGEFSDGEVALRAKIDMGSDNIKMRDPIIYRVRHVEHYRTGNNWCIYPMYDFTHGLSDMIEGVTHSLCTLEFEDHRPLYNWFLEKLETPCKPRQIEFSRLQLEYTVLSKRKLIQLVEENLVDGWDDPRMPTISGIRRRGIPASVLSEFCYKVGINKKDAVIEMSFFEGIARDHLNASSPRRMAVINPLKVTISNYQNDGEILQVANHPQDESFGKRDVSFSKTIYIEQDDFREVANKKFKRLKLGQEVRLRGSFVIRCDEIIKDNEGNPTELICSYDKQTLGKNPEDGRKVKGVIHWVDAKTSINAQVVEYQHLFNTENPMSADKFSDVINENSKKIINNVKVESSLETANLGEVFQFERVGYFTKDTNSNSENLIFNRTITLR